MALTIRRFAVLTIALLVASPMASALDFEREIARQQKTVKVRYKRPPKSIAHFMHQYIQCRSRYGVARTRCNIAEAKRHYNAYKVAWEEQQRRQVAMTTGDFQISLEHKERSQTEF